MDISHLKAKSDSISVKMPSLLTQWIILILNWIDRQAAMELLLSSTHYKLDGDKEWKRLDGKK